MMSATVAALLLQLMPCAPGEATATTLQAIIDAPERWLDRCVTVEARTSGRVLYARDGQDGENADRVGLDNAEAIGLRLARDRDVRVTVTGRVDSCRRRAELVRRETSGDRGRNFIVLLSGYCHYASGPVLVAWSGQVHR